MTCIQTQAAPQREASHTRQALGLAVTDMLSQGRPAHLQAARQGASRGDEGATWLLGEQGGNAAQASLWVLCTSENAAVFELRDEDGSEARGLGGIYAPEHGLTGAQYACDGRLTGVALTRRGVQHAALRLRCDPTYVEAALANLAALAPDEQLAHALQGISRNRPHAEAARAFYEAKVVEVLALAVDAQRRWRDEAAQKLEDADRMALDRARACIECNLHRNLAAPELADAALTSTSRLARVFRSVEGVTPQEYARSARMASARELLEASDLPMADISARLGFSRQGSFSEAFKARFGLTPHEYRTLCRAPHLG